MYLHNTKLTVIVPPTATACKNRNNKNPVNHGIRAVIIPVTICITPEKTTGNFRPNLEKSLKEIL